MAAMEFPAAPTVGQEYIWTPYTYVWDGEKWTTKVETEVEGYVKRSGDTMTGSLTVRNPAYGGVKLEGMDDRADVSHLDPTGVGRHTIRYSVTTDATDFIARNAEGVALRSYLWHDHAGGTTHIWRPTATDVQGTLGASLTRKDYVDGVFTAMAEEVASLRAQVQELHALLVAGANR